MADPLGDAARRRLTDAAVRELRADGYDVVRPDAGVEPPAVATRAGETVSVEPLASDDLDPTTVASRLGHAIERDRRALFVVGDADAERRARTILAAPALLVAEADGHRTFHAGPDRIPVEGGGYACFRSPGPGGPTIRWRETDTPIGPVAAAPEVDAAAIAETGRPVVPRVVCEVDGEVIAVLAGVASLRVPPATAFPYAYARNGDDKRFRVRRGNDGVVVDDFSGFAAMREAGYVPIPMPLVPEHLIGTAGDADSTTTVSNVDDRWRLLRSDPTVARE